MKVRYTIIHFIALCFTLTIRVLAQDGIRVPGTFLSRQFTYNDKVYLVQAEATNTDDYRYKIKVKRGEAAEQSFPLIDLKLDVFKIKFFESLCELNKENTSDSAAASSSCSSINSTDKLLNRDTDVLFQDIVTAALTKIDNAPPAGYLTFEQPVVIAHDYYEFYGGVGWSKRRLLENLARNTVKLMQVKDTLLCLYKNAPNPALREHYKSIKDSVSLKYNLGATKLKRRLTYSQRNYLRANEFSDTTLYRIFYWNPDSINTDTICNCSPEDLKTLVLPTGNRFDSLKTRKGNKYLANIIENIQHSISEMQGEIKRFKKNVAVENTIIDFQTKMDSANNRVLERKINFIKEYYKAIEKLEAVNLSFDKKLREYLVERAYLFRASNATYAPVDIQNTNYEIYRNSDEWRRFSADLMKNQKEKLSNIEKMNQLKLDMEKLYKWMLYNTYVSHRRLQEARQVDSRDTISINEFIINIKDRYDNRVEELNENIIETQKRIAVLSDSIEIEKDIVGRRSNEIEWIYKFISVKGLDLNKNQVEKQLIEKKKELSRLEVAKDSLYDIIYPREGLTNERKIKKIDRKAELILSRYLNDNISRIRHINDSINILTTWKAYFLGVDSNKDSFDAIQSEFKVAKQKYAEAKAQLSQPATPEGFKIHNIQLEFEAGNLKNLMVIGKMTSNFAQNDSIKFVTPYPVPFSSIFDFNYSAQLYSFNHQNPPDNYRYWIHLSDIFRYVPKFYSNAEDYSPADTTFWIKPGQQSIKMLHKNTVDRLLEARIYTDLVGIADDNPNGLIQTEVSKRIILRPNRKPIIIGRRPFYFGGYFNYIEPIAAFTKIESENRELVLKHSDTITYSGARTIDILRFSNFNLGAKMNLFVADRPQLKSSFYLDIGARLFRTAVIDSTSLGTVTSQDTTVQPVPIWRVDRFNANSIMSYLEFTWQIKPDHRFGFSLSPRISYFDLKSPRFKQTLRQEGSIEELRGGTPFWMAGIQMNAFIFPAENGRIFLRANYTFMYDDLKQDFFQAQLGYSFNILKRKVGR